MRIENANPVVALQVVRGKKTENVSETNGVDRTSISQRASDLSVGLDALKSAPEERAELIQSLKAQIDAGTFVVDERALAAKLLGGK